MADGLRLDILEGRVEELSRHWDRLFGETGRLDHKIETLGAGLSARIDELDQKFDRPCHALEQKLDRRFGAVDKKMDDLRMELSKQFR